MRLLKNRRDWLRFLRNDVGMYDREVKTRQGHADLDLEPVYPCYGYAVVSSYAFEEQRPVYVSIEDLQGMLKKLNGETK